MMEMSQREALGLKEEIGKGEVVTYGKQERL